MAQLTHAQLCHRHPVVRPDGKGSGLHTDRNRREIRAESNVRGDEGLRKAMVRSGPATAQCDDSTEPCEHGVRSAPGVSSLLPSLQCGTVHDKVRPGPLETGFLAQGGPFCEAVSIEGEQPRSLCVPVRDGT